MIEKQVDVKTPDGVADCELFYPSEQGAWPGVIMYTDIGGIRPVFRDMGKRLAGEGFVVLVPNPFYRVSRVPVYHDPFKFGEEKTAARMAEVRPSVTAAGAARDAPAFVDFLLGAEAGEGQDRHGRLLHGRRPCDADRRCRAGQGRGRASFHGSQLASNEPDFPHTLAPKIKAEMYFGFAIEDRTMPPEAVEKLKEALDAAGSNTTARSMRAPSTAGASRTTPSTTSPRPSAPGPRWSSLFREALR